MQEKEICMDEINEEVEMENEGMFWDYNDFMSRRKNDYSNN